MIARFFRATPASAWLVLVNVVAYVATAVQARSVLSNSRGELFLNGVLFPPAVAANDEWWRVVTSVFLHFGPVHLLLNMYMLWLLGVAVERSIGHWRYLALFLLSGLGGSAAVMLFSRDALTAGASGGLFGLMGAYAVVAVVLRVDFRGIAVLIALNVAVSFLVPGVSLAAHLGGLVTGALGALALVVLPRTLPARAGRGAREAVAWMAAALVLALVVWVCWYAADAMTLTGVYTS